MPQITCPNCGRTINLENRREIDLDLIRNAARREPKTFTALLHATKLPRKTLSLRLKELCGDGTLVKEEGMYRLNGISSCVGVKSGIPNGISRMLNDKKIRTGMMLAIFLLSSMATGYVLAMFASPPKPYYGNPKEPIVIGNFTMTLDVADVKDLFGWQIVISFNSKQLTVLETRPGNFFAVDYPFLSLLADTDGDRLLLGSCLKQGQTGKDGSGTLATIVFGYYVEEYELPQWVMEKESYETMLLDSTGAAISIEAGTLTLELVR
ncbi:MAG: cohesin domain-containing protein [Candidatus Bathyarchaeota archaeon]|nr:cohesin domain-containing protein [Candidatus Bathyarchaeota archaeon]